MANWGMKVSQDGFDVKTCTDDQLVFSSSFNALKTKAVGTATGATDVAHGLSYVPIFFTMTKVVGAETRYTPCQGSTVANTGCDGTNLRVNNAYAIRYYLFYQQGI